MKFLKCVIIRTFGKLCTLDKGLRKNSFETKLRKKKTVQEIFGFLENSPPECNLFVIGEFPRTVFFALALFSCSGGLIFCAGSRGKNTFSNSNEKCNIATD